MNSKIEKRILQNALALGLTATMGLGLVSSLTVAKAAEETPNGSNSQIQLSETPKNQGYSVNIDGETINFEIADAKQYQPYSVKAAKIMEEIGCKLNFDNVNNTLVITKGGISVAAPLNEDYMVVNGKKVTNVADTIVFKDESLPIKQILETFGADVVKVDGENVINIDSNNETITYDFQVGNKKYTLTNNAEDNIKIFQEIIDKNRDIDSSVKAKFKQNLYDVYINNPTFNDGNFINEVATLLTLSGLSYEGSNYNSLVLPGTNNKVGAYFAFNYGSEDSTVTVNGIDIINPINPRIVIGGVPNGKSIGSTASESLTKHEEMHSLFQYSFEDFPQLLIEGMTDQLTQEFYKGDDFNSTYDQPKTIIKLLCETIDPDFVMEQYSCGAWWKIEKELAKNSTASNAKTFTSLVRELDYDSSTSEYQSVVNALEKIYKDKYGKNFEENIVTSAYKNSIMQKQGNTANYYSVSYDKYKDAHSIVVNKSYFNKTSENYYNPSVTINFSSIDTGRYVQTQKTIMLNDYENQKVPVSVALSDVENLSSLSNAIKNIEESEKKNNFKVGQSNETVVKLLCEVVGKDVVEKANLASNSKILINALSSINGNEDAAKLVVNRIISMPENNKTKNFNNYALIVNGLEDFFIDKYGIKFEDDAVTGAYYAALQGTNGIMGIPTICGQKVFGDSIEVKLAYFDKENEFLRTGKEVSYTSTSLKPGNEMYSDLPFGMLGKDYYQSGKIDISNRNLTQGFDMER